MTSARNKSTVIVCTPQFKTIVCLAVVLGHLPSPPKLSRSGFPVATRATRMGSRPLGSSTEQHSENGSQVDGNQKQLFQDSGVGGRSFCTEASVASTVHSRQGQSLHKALKFCRRPFPKRKKITQSIRGRNRLLMRPET